MQLGERRRFKSSSHLYSRVVTINFFRLCWVVLLIWGELGIFFWSLSPCKWPDIDAGWKQPTRILLISDPQVRPPLALQGRTSWSSHARQFIFDLNLKKSWRITRRIHPQVVIFLGDMLANGKSISDKAEYQQYIRKFKSIFMSETSTSVYYIPGNNDIGMGASVLPSGVVRSNYANGFGPFNQEIVLRNHTFILLDAPGLVDEDYQRSARGMDFDKWKAIPGGSVSFIKNIAQEHNPLLLFSHIPLARPESAPCGGLRERGTLRQGVGHGYQNMLGKQTTRFLMKSLEPSAVFSGDNRDYCDYTHIAKDRVTKPTREVTVKSFSIANHIRHPGFQLLSLIDPPIHPNLSHTSFLDTPCHLPDQYGIYFSTYLFFFFFNVVSLLVLAIYRSYRGGIPYLEPLGISPHSSGQNTPVDPESAVWSPHTPVSARPQGSFPSYLRTPTSLAGPTLRASRPTTPLGSSNLVPVVYQPEEEGESMYPAQYVVKRDNHLDDANDKWSPGHDRISSDPPIPRFTLAPRTKYTTKRPLTWSWTFVFRGRRRRMTLRIPGYVVFRELWTNVGAWLCEGGSLGGRGVLYVALIDVLLVLWPAMFIWVLLVWWMF